MKKSILSRLLVLMLALALAVPTVVFTEDSVQVEAAVATEKTSGYTHNKLPYKSNSLSIAKLTFSKTQVVAVVKNNTGKAISGNTYFPYTCYNKNGEVVKTSSMYLAMANKDESSIAVTSIPESTTKIIFGDAVVKNGNSYTNPKKTKKVSGIKMNKFPVTYSKIKFTKAKIEKGSYSNTLTLTYKNATGKALSDYSTVLLKCYNSKGQVVEGGYKYLKAINKGDTTTVSFTLDKSVTAAYLLGAEAKEGKETKTGKTQKVDGIVVNATPYENSGITIESISFDGSQITLLVTNNTKKAIKDISSFNYKSYDKDGNVLRTSGFYLAALNPGESAYCTSSVTIGNSGELAKVIFDDVKIYEGDKIPVPSKYEKVGNTKMNVPYSQDGIKLEFKEAKTEYSTDYLYFIMTNKTGKAVSAPTINFRAFDSKGNILKTSTIYGEVLNNGEKTICKLRVDPSWAKLDLTSAKYGDGIEFSDIKTGKVNGVATNKTPYTNKNIEISKISISKHSSYSESYDASLTIKNKTGKAVDKSSYLRYKCYDADGYVMSSGSASVPALKAGETASVDISYISSSAPSKILFEIGKIN